MEINMGGVIFLLILFSVIGYFFGKENAESKMGYKVGLEKSKNNKLEEKFLELKEEHKNLQNLLSEQSKKQEQFLSIIKTLQEERNNLFKRNIKLGGKGQEEKYLETIKRLQNEKEELLTRIK